MSYIRYIRQLTPTLEILPGSVSWGNEDRYIDVVEQGTEDDVPADAMYAAMVTDNNIYSELICPPLDMTFIHHFAGWNPESFPVPTLS